MSRFLDLIGDKPETPTPVVAPAPTPAPVAKVVVEKPKVVSQESKVQQKTPTSSGDTK
jgi:hypothetical protein